MRPISTRAPEDLVSVGSVKGLMEVVADDRVSDLSTDRVRHVHRTTLRRANHETDSQWTTLTSSRGCREERELPAGADPTGHPN